MAQPVRCVSALSSLAPLLALSLLAGGCGSRAAPQVEARVVDAVNAARAAEGLSPLTENPHLRRLARGQSLVMLEGDKLCHENRLGETINLRADRIGIDWEAIAENVARNRGYHDPAAKATLDWLASPDHRVNILNPALSMTGVGAMRAEDGYTYITQIFMRPMP